MDYDYGYEDGYDDAFKDMIAKFINIIKEQVLIEEDERQLLLKISKLEKY